MASIQQALSATSLTFDRMTLIYAPFLSLTTRILGAPPKFLALAHASPLTHVFYLAALRSCFHLPECDLNLLPVPPALRRAALLESSIVHQCAYCTAHVASMGDVIKGPMVAQCTRRGDLRPATTPSEDVVAKLVAEVCSFPAKLSAETRDSFVAVYGDDGYAALASMVSFMGWLNFTMGAGGMRLESRMVPFAEAATNHRALPFTIRENMSDDKEEAVGVAEVSNVRRRGVWGALLEHARNAWGLLALIGPVASTMLAEKRWFGGIPVGRDELDEWCRRTLGATLHVFEGVTDPVLKRAIALGLRLVYVAEDPLWTREQKCLFLYVLAAGIWSERLKEDAVRLLDVTRGNGAEDAATALRVARSPDRPRDPFEAGLKFMHVCAGYADNVTDEVVEGLLEHVKEHRSIMDLVGMVGHFGFWHRAAVFYPGN